MVTLQRLIEKQEHAQNANNKIDVCMYINLGILLFAVWFAIPINAIRCIVLLLSASLVVLLILLFINKRHLKNINKNIMKSIERILKSTVEREIPDDDLVIVRCTKNNDKYFYFLIDLYSNVVSYEDLTCFTEPIVEDINEIINELLDIYYRIEKDEDA